MSIKLTPSVKGWLKDFKFLVSITFKNIDLQVSSVSKMTSKSTCEEDDTLDID